MCNCEVCQMFGEPGMDEEYSRNYREKQDRCNRLIEVAVQRGWKMLGTGMYRNTYISPSGKYVYKVPHNPDGIGCNEREHALFRIKEKKGYAGLERHQYARCRLAPSGILVMELVKPYFMSDKANGSPTTDQPPPDWAEMIDTGQVGLNREGNWVAYDYGNE